MTVKVTGFANEGDQVGVKGTNVFNKQEVTVWLTTKGKSFDNPNENLLLNCKTDLTLSGHHMF